MSPLAMDPFVRSIQSAGARRTPHKTVDEVLQIKNTHIVQELSLPPVKIHCSVLAEDGIKAAIQDWKRKRGEAPAEEKKAS